MFPKLLFLPLFVYASHVCIMFRFVLRETQMFIALGPRHAIRRYKCYLEVAAFKVGGYIENMRAINQKQSGPSENAGGRKGKGVGIDQ